jgi:PPOX class probable F420-dependent enzyme
MSTPDIASHRYVSITTRKRDGSTVSSPVWIAPVGDGTAGFTTGSDSGKVKRIRNFADVTLRPCDARGRVADGAPEVRATASVVEGPDAKPVTSAVKQKYGWQFTLVEVGGTVRGWFKKSATGDCAVVIRVDPPSA